MNKVIALGNLATKPKRRDTAGGMVTASFKLAVNRPPRQDGTQKTDFFWVKTWNGVAEAILTHLDVGSEVLIDGMIDAGDRKNDDGSYTHYSEVSARSVKFLRRPNGKPTDSVVEAEVETTVETPADEDIPF
jgi:single-strand DNA-binding protein